MSYDAKKLMKKYERIFRLKKNPFLRSDFSMNDFCELIGVNRTYASQFINNELHTSFHLLVRDVRLQHAEILLRENPEMKFVDVFKACGFANDTSFRRAYIAKYGCLPSENRQKQNESQEK